MLMMPAPAALAGETLPPAPAALPGVRATIAACFVICLAGVLRLLYVSRHRLSAAPSALAVTGTRWCKAGDGARAAARRRGALFAFRLTFALWQLVVLTSLTVRNARGPKGAQQFLFFTVWNYALQTLCWAVAAAASAASLCSASGPGAALRRTTHTLLSICVPMALLVSIVLWAVLCPEALHRHEADTVLNFYSYNMHALNTIALLVEASVDRLLLQRGTLAPLLLWGCAYAAFAWLVNALTGGWPLSQHARPFLIARFCCSEPI